MARGGEATLEMRMLVYNEEKIHVLEDIYSLEKDCVLEKRPAKYEELITQNHSKYKFSERMNLPEVRDGILQICHSGGRIQIEHMEVKEEGVQIEGLLHIHFLYVKANDQVPFDMWTGILPFSYLIESPSSCSNMKYDITPSIEQISIDMAGSEEIEVKTILAFQSFLRCPVETEVIDSMEWKPFDSNEMSRRPGIIGYIIKEGDDLWKLAKRYYTTEEGIMEINGLSSKELKAGDKLLILKENMSIL